MKLAKFAPSGERGVCRFVRARNYSGTDRNDCFAAANNTVIMLQLEGKEPIANLDEILAVDGIDIIFIGPYDLSQYLSLSGEIDHPSIEL